MSLIIAINTIANMCQDMMIYDDDTIWYLIYMIYDIQCDDTILIDDIYYTYDI